MNWMQDAHQQSGVVHRDQLRASAMSESQVQWMIGTGRLRQVYPRVYLHASIPADVRQQLWALTLWSGGVVSHRSASKLLGLDQSLSIDTPDARLHMTVADRRFRTRQADVKLHRVRLPGSQISWVDGLAVTSRTRTIIDLLRTESSARATAIFDRCLQNSWITEHDVRAELSRQLGRAGNTQLRVLLSQIEPSAHAESERLLHRVMRGAGLTGWVAQHPVRLGERIAYLDVAFPDVMLGIEVDGRRYHDSASDRFESDRSRQNALIRRGWLMLRFTWRRLIGDPLGVIAEIEAALTLRTRR